MFRPLVSLARRTSLAQVHPDRFPSNSLFAAYRGVSTNITGVSTPLSEDTSTHPDTPSPAPSSSSPSSTTSPVGSSSPPPSSSSSPSLLSTDASSLLPPPPRRGRLVMRIPTPFDTMPFPIPAPPEPISRVMSRIVREKESKAGKAGRHRPPSASASASSPLGDYQSPGGDEEGGDNGREEEEEAPDAYDLYEDDKFTNNGRNADTDEGLAGEKGGGKGTGEEGEEEGVAEDPITARVRSAARHDDVESLLRRLPARADMAKETFLQAHKASRYYRKRYAAGCEQQRRQAIFLTEKLAVSPSAAAASLVRDEYDTDDIHNINNSSGVKDGSYDGRAAVAAWARRQCKTVINPCCPLPPGY